jgi:hypothetical protein
VVQLCHYTQNNRLSYLGDEAGDVMNRALLSQQKRDWNYTPTQPLRKVEIGPVLN